MMPPATSTADRNRKESHNARRRVEDSPNVDAPNVLAVWLPVVERDGDERVKPPDVPVARRDPPPKKPRARWDVGSLPTLGRRERKRRIGSLSFNVQRIKADSSPARRRRGKI